MLYYINPFNWVLVNEPGFFGPCRTFDMFWSGKEHVWVLRTNPETSGRDLAVGMDEAWYGAQIWQKK